MNQISKFDKTGKRIKQHDNLMANYYQIQKDQPENQKHEKLINKKYYDDDGQFEWNPEQASDEESSSSTSDFSESDDDEGESGEDKDSEVWNDDDAEIPLGEAKEDEEVGSRLALNKMDWDVLSAIDILALFRGLCSGTQQINKVVVYPSLFGLEQMKKDSLFGPPQEIFSNKPIN